MRLIGEDFIPKRLDTNAARLPTELRGTSESPVNRHCQNKRNKNGAGSLALRRCQVYPKSTCSGVTMHFRTWVPYLTLLPIPSPTRGNFLMQDFLTILHSKRGTGLWKCYGYKGFRG